MAIDSPLGDYQPNYATLADLLARTGRRADAISAYDQALALTINAAERDFLERQRRAVTMTPEAQLSRGRWYHCRGIYPKVMSS